MWCKKCSLLTAIKDAFMMKMNAFIQSSSSSSSAPVPSGQRLSSASPWTDFMMPQPTLPQSYWWSSPTPSFWRSPPSSSSNWWWWC
ncbi:hypothetical protein FWK35_00026864 [Aphis craccivora]|uniref:Uncharacterized protein n=1 Tax=Aphis craccivora TaxID=307492 RepID=A0A6G0YJH0_APHCR|nr:hypothetical protein FWK35_00026864 [Aphis craccivora]